MFLERWLARCLPRFRPMPRAWTTAAATPRRLGVEPRLAGTGTQEPLWDRLGMLTMPVLVLAGERDERFSALGRRIAHTIGSNAVFALVPAGHAAHLEEPEAFLRVLRDWPRSSGAQGQAEREERAEAELQATGLRQDADQAAARCTLAHPADRADGEGMAPSAKAAGQRHQIAHASAPMKASATSAP